MAFKTREYKLDDVNERDMELLTKCASLPEKTMFCFGASTWYKLLALNIISDDSRPTYYGLQFLKAYQRKNN